MTENDHLLAFALKWRHWGGGSAGDILVEFGITPTDYFQRLRDYLHSGAAPKLPEHVVHQLDTLCITRLAQSGLRHSH
ncbi:DUF3263 domain-containing protein [Rhodococcus oryzae]|uniref:DUF3263 domain-containing protein n=1 Tax=Rhodococcus oryzae TaxID=2571143 RepID=A0ABY2RGJ7_9NOCA|nr:DUF3263 domain-containing protein [Rhodococcus oryzae]TJZ76054.1 DUF3263 domain-containing protein [Rhodococcus oryzae]